MNQRSKVTMMAPWPLLLAACAAAPGPEPAVVTVPTIEVGEPEEAKVVKPPAPSDPHEARQQALRDATQAGILGVLQADGEAGEGDAALGALWGDTIGDSFGLGGLGLTGKGSGSGGGEGEGVGLGSIGTIGHGGGGGVAGGGYGSGSLGGSGAGAPKVTAGTAATAGSLAPEIIRRIVRASLGRVRLCYEAGLVKNAKLAGKVSVRFVIGKDGKVTEVSTAGDLADKAVVRCITRVLHGLSFPKPDPAGVVTVQYPLVFSPATPPLPATPGTPAP